MQLKIIITGATGLVGEGVLLTCLKHPDVKQVLMVNRKHFDLEHPKLRECIVPDFMQMDNFVEQLSGYDACFYCAGISSAGMKEAEYTLITYDTTISFAQALLKANPAMIFNYISGGHTDSSEKGKIMWARVKGKTENALMKLGFKNAYNFRPGFMKPLDEQKNVRGFYKAIGKMYGFLKFVFPKHGVEIKSLGTAMINTLTKGYDKQILENTDIDVLAKR